MSAPEGNNYNMKWKTPEERKAACESVCKHLEQGLSQNCFPDADWDTVERYMKEFPQDFPSEKIKEARRKGRMLWEGMGRDGAFGKVPNFNATSWIFNMKNRYKEDWRDKHEHGFTNSQGQDIAEDIEFLKRFGYEVKD
jgi:hypothetical protein